MFKLLFLLLSLTNTYTYADTKLEAGNVYDITWNETKAEQVNLELEILINDTWVSHDKQDNSFLSVILDGKLGKYNWDVPSELSEHWNYESRITLSDTNSDDIILNRMFNFYGMTIYPIEDLYINETLHISWNTNIQKNFTLILTNGKDEFPIVEYINDLEYYTDLTDLPELTEGEYYVVIKYHIENLENDNDILTSCVGGRNRRSCVGGRRNRRGCCLRLTGTFESNRFNIMEEELYANSGSGSFIDNSGSGSFIDNSGSGSGINPEVINYSNNTKFKKCLGNIYCVFFLSITSLSIAICLICGICMCCNR
jgi:hypothetical protein